LDFRVGTGGLHRSWHQWGVISDASWVKMAREGKNHSILGFVKKL